jgi:HAD superfamily hydrolase (TIGR01509 family)
MNQHFKALILDMDGVFIDTETLVFDIFRKVFEPFNIQVSNEYQYKFIGKPFSSNLDDIKKDFNIEFDNDTIRDTFDDTYEKMLSQSPLSVQHGIKEIVRTAQHKGFKLALCTTSNQHHVNAVFKKVKENSFDPSLFFNAVVTGDSVQNRKPHPEPYLTAAHKIGQTPEQCLVIEDSLSGITSAKSAGCFCIGLRQPYNAHIDFSRADKIINRLTDVIPML